MNWGQQAIAAMAVFVLAALVGPADFGTVAMAGVYIWFVHILAEQGLTPAVIQRKHLSPLHLDAAFWIVMAMSLLCTAGSIFAAGWWAQINRLPELEQVVRTLSLLLPMLGLSVVPQAILQRAMDFRRLAVRTNVSALAGAVIGVTLALRGWGVWALVAQNLSATAVGMVALWTLCPWRPGFRFSLAHARDLLGFSWRAVLGTFGVFFNRQSDALIMGVLFGPAAVGLYRLADRAVGTASDGLTRSLSAVALPSLSKLQEERSLLKERMLRIIRLSAILMLPTMGVLAGLSDALLPILGDKWVPAATPLRILCIVGAVQGVMMFTGSALNAVAKPQWGSALVWITALAAGAAFIAVGLHMRQATTASQTASIAAARAAVYVLIHAPLALLLARWLCGVGILDFLRTITPAATTGALSGLLAYALSHLAWIAGLPPIARVAIATPLPAITCLLLLFAIEPMVRYEILRRVSGQHVELPSPT